MSDKPTGVFVRLPLSNEQLGNLLIPTRTFNERMISIGTPVTGGKEICSGSVKWHENDREPTLETYVPNAFGRGKSVKIVTLSDHQAHIAALEAEVVRKDQRIAELEGELSGFRAGLSELIAKEVAALKGGAA